ncbi:MAG TPA: class I SAM-dependent methyltransferase [Stenomitos sp.]
MTKVETTSFSLTDDPHSAEYFKLDIAALLDLDHNMSKVLNVGCSGATAALFKSLYPQVEVIGIADTPQKMAEVSAYISQCYCLDLDQDPLPFEDPESFDAFYFCHSLQQFVDPVFVLNRLLPYLKVGGKVWIVLPNVARWRKGLKGLQSKFESAGQGISSQVGRHFYTFQTAPSYFLDAFPQLHLYVHRVTGLFPLPILRGTVLSEPVSKMMNRLGCRFFPNLVGMQILMAARKICP